ncbi:unnamed protein product [Rhizophagus irregularis]|uniref:Uncharacterized protein n=1 Tax=Rhizophagus irregularis TaxID=588596 RepID=A0A916DZH4_9GLOM|nr:unnamed protein product [Rhizophagus irregularis]
MGLQIYWETIIYEREKMKAQRAHLTGSMRVYVFSINLLSETEGKEATNDKVTPSLDSSSEYPFLKSNEPSFNCLGSLSSSFH